MIGSDACVLLRWTLPPKRSARLAQRAESASSRLIKMLIAFSERHREAVFLFARTA
mgnify:CR=1 FL=1